MPSRPTIAVVGASVRSAAFSLLRAGCDIVAADLFADADLKRVCPSTQISDYPEGLADWLAATKCDGWLYTGALENHPELIDFMAMVRPLFGNRGEAVRHVRDVFLLQKVLRAAGLNFPETKPCNGLPPGDGEWLHKTGKSVRAPGQKSRAVGLVPTDNTGFWQRRIEGLPGSAIYIAEGSRTCTLRGITRQLVGETWTGASEFQYCGTLAPWNLPMPVTADLTQVGQVLTTQCKLLGLFGVDFIFDGERVWIVEVNPRPTAAVEVVERTTDINLLARHLTEFGINVNANACDPIPAAGKVVLYAKHPLAVLPELSAKLLNESTSHDPPKLADIPHSGTEIARGAPVLTVLADGQDLKDVEATLRRRVAALEAELYRDVGGKLP